jgi:hypothetical protein
MNPRHAQHARGDQQHWHQFEQQQRAKVDRITRLTMARGPNPDQSNHQRCARADADRAEAYVHAFDQQT